MSFADIAWQGLLAPLTYVFDPSRRLYLLSLLTSLLAAMLVFRQLHGGKSSSSRPGFLRWLLPLRILWHPSARLDYQLLFFNAAFKAVFVTPYLATRMVLVIMVAGWCRSLAESFAVSLPNDWLAQWQIIVLYSVTLFLLDDFTRFYLHSLMHRLPFLWRFHQLHHSAQVMTPITLYRAHPVENTLSTLRSLCVFSSVTGIFVFVFPQQVSALEILGVDAFGFLFNLAASNLRHSHIPLSFGRLNRFFVSPVMHQLHHSQAAEHQNSNFGSCLSIWDGLIDSRCLPDVGQRLRFGLGRGQMQEHHLLAQLFRPISPGKRYSGTLTTAR